MELLNGKDWELLISNIDNFLFDCDGVLWEGNTIIPGGVEAITYLKSRNKRIFFVTNNSTKSRVEYVKKFTTLGYPVEFEQIICTAFATGYYMKNVLNFEGKAYLMGRPGFKQELNELGINTSKVGPDLTSGELDAWSSIPLDPDITGVIVGFDEYFNYKKMTLAATYLSDPNCKFIATNEDNILPTGTKVILPGSGSLLEAVKFVSQREPVVIGKPHSPIFECLKSMANIDQDRTVMVGDRLGTDIAFGNRNGLKTVLTLSGVTSREQLDKELAKPASECKPKFYTNSLQTLTKEM
ncbi:Phosphoglycolate phosphatase-like [Oopsacas minuta]|uniref:Phosphoglycolate phosphatase-like n=1 Tax=Oopsacas minuta TaxID=111878 RepID=A0AAV7K5F5_9METZ|nr:Phosphoglycolate phosphatase-like [Oopsacas minuta]